MSQPPTSSVTRDVVSQPTDELFETLAIVGVGLLGGSVALAAKRAGLVRTVIGVGRNGARLAEAKSASIVDEIETDLRAAASRADLIVVGLPVDRIAESVREAAAASRSGTILTDVGSTKARIVSDLRSGLPAGVTFIGSHPLAGSEKAGWNHARADLFSGRVCVITPTDSSPPESVDRLTTFWQRIGLTVLSMSPEAHDRTVAQTSHVPHVVASALARTLAEENRPFAATGFADTTRIAAGDPNVWVPILLQNADEVIAGLDRIAGEVTAYRNALAQRDAAKLTELWTRGRTIREQCSIRGSQGNSDGS